jgi:hypothetical protein
VPEPEKNYSREQKSVEDNGGASPVRAGRSSIQAAEPRVLRTKGTAHFVVGGSFAESYRLNEVSRSPKIEGLANQSDAERKHTHQPKSVIGEQKLQVMPVSFLGTLALRLRTHLCNDRQGIAFGFEFADRTRTFLEQNQIDEETRNSVPPATMKMPRQPNPWPMSHAMKVQEKASRKRKLRLMIRITVP